MNDIFAKFAEGYAKEIGCDSASAHQAAFVAAALFADAVGHKDLGDYFTNRAIELEPQTGGERWKEPTPFGLEVFEPAQITQIIPANEIEYEAAAYRNGYWI